MSISIRTRFDIFKRDNFTCQYCGRSTPEVVLECDHIVPVCEGGNDDPINLRTACWECNHGKAGIPLETVSVGEDPTERAILLLERERQLREYNIVLEQVRARRDADAWELLRYWTNNPELHEVARREYTWLMNTLTYLSKETIRNYMDAAITAGATDDLRYVKGCVRNYRESQQGTGRHETGG